MCFGGGGQTRQQPPREYQNRPVTVTGTQTGVDDPKDTAKATETLKIKRKKEEGTYVDPNLTTAEMLSGSSGGSGGAVARNKRAMEARRGYSRGNPTKAQSMAKARMGRKSISGRSKSRTA